MPPRPRRGKAANQPAPATEPELKVATENTPPTGTNSHLLHLFTTTSGLPASRMKTFKTALISAETMKRPDLMVSGAAFTPDGPMLGPGLKAPTLDELDEGVVRKAIKELAEKELSDEQKTRVQAAGLLGDNTASQLPAATAASTKRPLDDASDSEDGNLIFSWNCDQVRRRINTFLESGEMRVTEFQRAISVNSNSYGRFMKMKGPTRGIDNSTMSGAYKFFKAREKAGIKPAKKTKTSAAEAVDLSGITLEGEETDSVEVYDSCDEIRRKISAYLRKPGVTQVQFLKDLAAQFHTRGAMKLQSKQLNDFRGKKGADAGNTSAVFYGGYVFFEKLRIKEGKAKSKHRVEMENVWGGQGGFDIKNASHNRGYVCRAGSQLYTDAFGRVTSF